MQPLQWEYRPDGLRAPALICAFKGWNDAADAASSAITFVGTALGAKRFATIDPEEFYDFQATRPRIKLVDGHAREIVWPEVELYEARIPRAPRDLILLSGTEPSFRWRTFGGLVVELAEALGTQLVRLARCVAGGCAAHAPGVGDRARVRPGTGGAARSEPILVRRTDRDHRRAPRRLPGRGAAVGEPVGGGAALHRGRSQPEGGARARAQARGPRAGRGRRLRSRERDRRLRPPGQSRGSERSGRPGVFVERLEQAAESEPGDELGSLPSGDSIARDLQRFLRQRGGEGEGPSGAGSGRR